MRSPDPDHRKNDTCKNRWLGKEEEIFYIMDNIGFNKSKQLASINYLK